MSTNWPTVDQVFILRFWREEAGANRQFQWRVQIQNVNTRRRHIVDNVDRAFAIITARLDAASDVDAGGQKMLERKKGTQGLITRVFMVVWIMMHPIGIARAQNTVPPELIKAIDDIGTKFSELISDKAKLDAAVKLLDAKFGEVRNKSDPIYVDGILSDLKQWIAGLSDGQKAAAREKLKTLIEVMDQLRDVSDSDRAKRIIAAAVSVLQTGKFSGPELEGLAKEQSIKDIGAELDKLLKDQKPGIHIISASYGNHRNGMTCDATAYFRGRCEGKSNNCPEAAATINGDTLCGYEPAPLAASGRNSARVRYQCLSFRLRPLDPLGCTREGCGTTVELRGKGQIICAPNP